MRIEFTEEWSYDPETLRPIKIVNGMTLLFPVYSLETGEYMGNRKKVQIWFDDKPMLEYPA